MDTWPTTNGHTMDTRPTDEWAMDTQVIQKTHYNLGLWIVKLKLTHHFLVLF